MCMNPSPYAPPPPPPPPYLPTDNLGNNLALDRLTCTQEAKRKPRWMRSACRASKHSQYFLDFFSNLEMSNCKKICLPLIISFGPQVLYITLPHFQAHLLNFAEFPF